MRLHRWIRRLCTGWVSLLAVASLASAAASATALAREALPASNDPALELRVLRVAEELRCLVCQNETIAASQAELAQDLRAQIREQLRNGRDETQILDFMVSRYGEFILYRPPWRASTVLLWLGPFALLLLALMWMRGLLRQRGTADAVTSGDASDDEARGLALLQRDASSPTAHPSTRLLEHSSAQASTPAGARS